MPKLRHIALHCTNPEEVAEFYKRVFDMVEVGRTDSNLADGIYLSDGDLNMAILKFKSDQAADRGDGMGPVMGLHHFGFWVENAEEVRRKLQEAGAKLHMSRDPNARTSFFEEKWVGAGNVQFDISEAGWRGARPPAEAVGATAASPEREPART